MTKKITYAHLLLLLNFLQLVAPFAALHAATPHQTASLETFNLKLPTRKTFKELSQCWEGLAPAAYVKDTSDASTSSRSRDALLKFVGAQHASLRKSAGTKPIFEALSFLHDLAAPGKAIENRNCTPRLMTDIQMFGEKGVHASIDRTALALSKALQLAQLYEGADSVQTATERRDFITGLLKKPDVARALSIRIRCFGQYENQFLRQTNAPRNKYLEKRIQDILPSRAFGPLRNSSWFLKWHAFITQKTAHIPFLGFDSIKAAYMFSTLWIALSLGARGLGAQALKTNKENILLKLGKKARAQAPTLASAVPQFDISANNNPASAQQEFAAATKDIAKQTAIGIAHEESVAAFGLGVWHFRLLSAFKSLISSRSFRDALKNAFHQKAQENKEKITLLETELEEHELEPTGRLKRKISLEFETSKSMPGGTKLAIDLATGPFLPFAVVGKLAARLVSNALGRTFLELLNEHGSKKIKDYLNAENRLANYPEGPRDAVELGAPYVPSLRLDGYRALRTAPDAIQEMALKILINNPDKIQNLIQPDPENKRAAASVANAVSQALDLTGIYNMQEHAEDTQRALTELSKEPFTQKFMAWFTPFKQGQLWVMSNLIGASFLSNIFSMIPSAKARNLPAAVFAWTISQNPLVMALRVATGNVKAYTNPLKRTISALLAVGAQPLVNFFRGEEKDIIRLGKPFRGTSGDEFQLMFHLRPLECLKAISDATGGTVPKHLFSIMNTQNKKFLNPAEAQAEIQHAIRSSGNISAMARSAAQVAIEGGAQAINAGHNAYERITHNQSQSAYGIAPASHLIGATNPQSHQPRLIDLAAAASAGRSLNAWELHQAVERKIQQDANLAGNPLTPEFLHANMQRINEIIHQAAEEQEQQNKQPFEQLLAQQQQESNFLWGGFAVESLALLACWTLGTAWSQFVAKSGDKAFDAKALDEHMFMSLKPTVALAEMARQISKILNTHQRAIPLPTSLHEKLSALITTASPECREFSALAQNPLFLRKKLPGMFGNFGVIRRAYQLADMPSVRQWLKTCAVFVAELDSYLAIGRLAAEHRDNPNYYNPVEFIQSETPHIELHDFWFPVIGSFKSISNTITMANPAHILLTGLNGGGKSVALKGMIFSLLMTHAFGYGPLTGGKLTFFSQMITHLSSTDNTAEGDSCWMAEAKAMGKALHEMQAPRNPGEFILFVGDELGSGTADHAAIAAVARFIEVAISTPHVASIISTHLRPLTQLEEITGGKIKNYCVGGTVDENNVIQRKFRLERGAATMNIAVLIANQIMDEGGQKTAVHPDNLPQAASTQA